MNDCNEMENEDEEDRPKLRKRNPENWKQNIRKRNKNKGLEYIKANGELCKQKTLGPPCTCKEKCYMKIGIEACKKIFKNFWKLGDHSLQNAYIAGCVRIFLPKHCYKKDGLPSRRFFSRNFQVNVNGVDTEVCKQAFLNMHAISNGRLDRLLKKKQEIGNTGVDERGRHSNKVNKIPFEKINLVREHINGFRKRAGFTGKRKPKKVELLPGLLNIRSMYRCYREEMISKGLEPVCEYRYRKIFHSDFHLEFGKTGAQCNSNESHSMIQLQEQTTSDLDDKAIIRSCRKNDDLAKVEPRSRNVYVNMETVSGAKMIEDKTIYPKSETENEFPLGTSDVASYVIPQEVFKLDYTVYSPPQQNWMFSNQS